MAVQVALVPFDAVQIGRESSKGTRVAATRRLVGNGMLKESIDRYFSAYPRNVLATVGDDGVVTRQGTEFTMESELTPQEILWPLLLGLKGNVTPSGALSGTSDAAVSFTGTTMQDTRLTMEDDQYIGATITADGKTGVVVSNTDDTFTVSSWVTGTPTDESAWSLVPLDFHWPFSPTLGSVPGLDSATVEFMLSDGSTNHVQIEAGYVMASSLSVEFAFNQIAKLSWNGFGRARQADTPTGALVPYTNRKQLVSPLTGWYADDDWAGLGGTQLAGIVRSGKYDLTLFPQPDYTMDQRADLDFVSHRITPFAAKLSLVLEVDSAGAAEYGKWRTGTRRFIRSNTLGAALGGSAYGVQFDGSYRNASAPQFSDDNGQRLVTLDLEAVYDKTATKIVEVTVTNDLASVAAL